MNKSKRFMACRKKQKQRSVAMPAVNGAVSEPMPPVVASACAIGEEASCSLILYDENLLERSHTQWQVGDWESLAKLSHESLQHHPDRAKLALLAAAGLLQTGDTNAARQFVRMAQDWGCGKKLISQILIAGVHNSLGKASALGGQKERPLHHFEKAIATATPGGDVRLLSQARIHQQLAHFGLPPFSQIKKENEAPSVQPEPTTPTPNKKEITKQKFGSDARIDDFIEDLTPFFSSRSITYVDVGSFIGEVFLKIYQSKKINIREAHLYEPNPDSYQKLKKNISQCAITSLHAYNFAISKQSRNMLFLAARSMTKHLDIRLDTNAVSNTFKADSFLLDDLAATFTDRHIDLLKVDVEGEEIEVLSSASNLLEEQRIDVIYIEAGLNKDGNQQTYLADIDIFLQGYRYRMFKIYEQINEWIRDSPLLRRCNIVYMSSQFAQANPYNLTIENDRLRKELAVIKSSC
jgi:FkbM family methyltransferase